MLEFKIGDRVSWPQVNPGGPAAIGRGTIQSLESGADGSPAAWIVVDGRDPELGPVLIYLATLALMETKE